VDGDDEVVERDVPAGPSFDPVREILVEERARALRGVLARLDETCAKAIGLFYMDGVAYKDMAEMLSISINTVGARLSKCLDKLRGMALNDAQLGDEPAG
jgi:RNA polymerase sigma factor (sigma-70 family)